MLRNGELENPEDATFQQAKDVDYSPEYFAQNRQNGNPRLENSSSEQNTRRRNVWDFIWV